MSFHSSPSQTSQNISNHHPSPHVEDEPRRAEGDSSGDERPHETGNTHVRKPHEQGDGTSPGTWIVKHLLQRAALGGLLRGKPHDLHGLETQRDQKPPNQFLGGPEPLPVRRVTPLGEADARHEQSLLVPERYVFALEPSGSFSFNSVRTPLSEIQSFPCGDDFQYKNTGLTSQNRSRPCEDRLLHDQPTIRSFPDLSPAPPRGDGDLPTRRNPASGASCLPAVRRAPGKREAMAATPVRLR